MKTSFTSWKIDHSKSINENWTEWKNLISKTADETLGKKRIPRNYKAFWDKDIKRLIQERREINTLKRKVSSSSSIFPKIEELYKERKMRVQNVIKQKQYEKESKAFFQKVSWANQ